MLALLVFGDGRVCDSQAAGDAAFLQGACGFRFKRRVPAPVPHWVEAPRSSLSNGILMIKAIKGTRDILPQESVVWNQVEETAREILSVYGFSEIRTPVFESTELFARGVGEDTDIVAKEMYTFDDRDSRSLTLRPEGTASVVRAYLEHQLHRDPQIWKVYYMGPMFRRERPQKGRFRQFHQLGAEVLGSDHPAIEAEVIELLQLFLDRIGVGETELLVNSIGSSQCRARFSQKLQVALSEREDALCPDCRRRCRSNPLRVLDCKRDPCQPAIETLPSILEFLDEPCRLHFDRFLGHLKRRDIRFKVVPRLVRGLDYYSRTTFEITSPRLGAQNALVGGGRYDGLAEVLGGQPTHGFGFALGLERVILLCRQAGSSPAAGQPQLFFAPLGERAFDRASLMAREFRRRGIRCFLDFASRTLKSSMRLANKLQAGHVLIVGENELETGEFPLKRMSDGRQTLVREEEIISRLGNGWGD